MSYPKSRPHKRWRHINAHQPPRGRLLLLYNPELRGAKGPMDEGVRFGYWAGSRLQGWDVGANVKFERWWAYPQPPRVGREPDLSLTGEMRIAVERLEKQRKLRKLKPLQPIPYKELGIKYFTMVALVRRKVVKTGGGGFYLPNGEPDTAPGNSAANVRR